MNKMTGCSTNNDNDKDFTFSSKLLSYCQVAQTRLLPVLFQDTKNTQIRMCNM